MVKAEHSAVTTPNPPAREHTVFESYPARIVILANGLTLSIYALGICIMSRLDWWFLSAYVLFLAYLEIRLLAKSCVHCHYYGKACFSGRGVVCAWFFKRGDPSRFDSREVSRLMILPDFLVTLIPLAVGIFLLVRRFDILLLLPVVGIVILAFPVTGWVRGTTACCRCRQRVLGCPAEKLFRPKQHS